MSVSAAESARTVAIRTNPQVPPSGSRLPSERMPSMTERETPSVDGLVIGILSGTGDQGRGLARRFALAGHPVIIGSRSPERAAAAAQEIGHGVQGQANADAAAQAGVVIA